MALQALEFFDIISRQRSKGRDLNPNYQMHAVKKNSKISVKLKNGKEMLMKIMNPIARKLKLYK